MIFFLFFTILLSHLQCSESANLVGRGTKAASALVNCGCQCSPLTFRDKYGRQQGNCKSADKTGAVWCYVHSAHYSSCSDLQPSKRFPNNPWSYEACATPQQSSADCQQYSSSLTCRGNSCPGLSANQCQCPVCPVVKHPRGVSDDAHHRIHLS